MNEFCDFFFLKFFECTKSISLQRLVNCMTKMDNKTMVAHCTYMLGVTWTPGITKHVIISKRSSETVISGTNGINWHK